MAKKLTISTEKTCHSFHVDKTWPPQEIEILRDIRYVKLVSEYQKKAKSNNAVNTVPFKITEKII